MTTPNDNYDSYKFSEHPTADIVSPLIILMIFAAEAVFIYNNFYFVTSIPLVLLL